MHHHYFHPKSERLYGGLKRADPERSSAKDLKKLEEIEKYCDICQKLRAAPYRFRVSLPNENLVFICNFRVDIMSTIGNTVLDVVDRETKYNAAALLIGKTVHALWNTYMRIGPWGTQVTHNACIGIRGQNFQSRRWEGLCHTFEIELKLSEVEEQNSLAKEERYHSYLRSLFLKILNEFRRVDTDYALQLAGKAVNDTAGPNDLVPTLLVLGTLPRLPVPMSTDQRGQKERMDAIDAARKEFASIIAKWRIGLARKQNIPAAASGAIKSSVACDILVYRDPPSNKWKGLCEVLDYFEKHLFVDFKGRMTKFSVTRIKSYHKKDSVNMNKPPADHVSPNVNPIKASDNVIKDIRLDVGARKLHQHEPIQADDIYTNFLDSPILLAEFISHGDALNDHEYFEEAKSREINGLCTRNAFKILNEVDIPKDGSILSGRFVNSIKNKGVATEQAQFRYLHKVTRLK